MEVQTLTGDGVGEPQLFGMQVETVGGLTVELVAKDGAAETILVSAVHTQLMGATGMGGENDVRRETRR